MDEDLFTSNHGARNAPMPVVAQQTDFSKKPNVNKYMHSIVEEADELDKSRSKNSDSMAKTPPPVPHVIRTPFQTSLQPMNTILSTQSPVSQSSHPSYPGHAGQPSYPSQLGHAAYPGNQGHTGYPSHAGQPSYPSLAGHAGQAANPSHPVLATQATANPFGVPYKPETLPYNLGYQINQNPQPVQPEKPKVIPESFRESGPKRAVSDNSLLNQSLNSSIRIPKSKLREMDQTVANAYNKLDESSVIELNCDENGFLIDDKGFPILDDNGQPMKLSDDNIDFLKENGLYEEAVIDDADN